MDSGCGSAGRGVVDDGGAFPPRPLAAGSSRGSIRRPTRRSWTPLTTTVLLPDVNVLLAGFRADHDHHKLARSFLEGARSGSTALGFSDVALASVVRLATNPRVFVRPDTTDAVIEYLDVLLEAPAQLLRAGSMHWPRFTDLCRHLQLRGNLVPD